MIQYLRELFTQITIEDVQVSLPFGVLSGDIIIGVDRAQRNAAWELYVEIATRVVAQPLEEHHGLLREALSSMYSIFIITREILRKAGPKVTRGEESLGVIALAVLNQGFRPFLSKWHPLLKAYEETRPDGMSEYEHERNWKRYNELRSELIQVQGEMRKYLKALAKIAGIPHVEK